MDIQTKIINKIGVDKILHLFAGGWLSALFEEWYYSLFVALMVGVLKEVIDCTIRKGKADMSDAIATFTGGVITVLVRLL